MPLPKQIIDIPFTGGMDTGTDPKLVSGSVLHKIKNMFFEKTGLLKKRNGYEQLGNEILVPAKTTVVRINQYKPIALLSYANNLMIILKTNLYVYAEAARKWITNSTNPTAGHGNTSLIDVNVADVWSDIYGNKFHVSVEYLNGYYFVLWMSYDSASVSRTYVEVVSASDMSRVHGPQQIGLSSPIVARLLKTSSQIWVVYEDDATNADIRVDYCDISDVKTWTSALIVNDRMAGTNGSANAIVSSTGVGVLAYAHTTGGAGINRTRVVSFDSTGFIAEISASVYGFEYYTDSMYGIGMDKGGNIYILSYDTTRGLYKATLNSAFAVIDAYRVIDNDVTVDIKTIITAPRTTSSVSVFYDKIGIATEITDLAFIKAVLTCNATAAGSAAIVRKRGCVIASGAIDVDYGKDTFDIYFSVSYDLGIYSSTYPDQSTLFLLSSGGRVCARELAGQYAGGILPLTTGPSTICKISDSRIAIACRKKIRTPDSKISSGFLGTLGVASEVVSVVTFDFWNKPKFTETRHGTFFTGGMLQHSDAFYVRELGLNVYPHKITSLTASNTATGAIDAGTHYYVAIYESFDVNGNIYRSAPSQAKSINVVVPNDTVLIEAPAYRMTNIGQYASVVSFYRTTVGGSQFYYVGSVINNTGANSVSMYDYASDASVSANQTLYTTGGVLDNIPPPAVKHICAGGNRLFVSDGNKTVWYTKDLQENIGPEFNDALIIGLYAENKNITGLSYIDGNLIIFKKNYIYRVYGDGPNDLGQGQFSNPILISSGIGSVDNSPIVKIPIGLIFKSDDGLKLLGRDFSVQGIGQAVRDYDQYSVLSSSVCDAKQQARFVLSDNKTVLVFDYHENKWLIYEYSNIIDSISVGDNWYFLSDNSNVNKEQVGFIDHNKQIEALIETSWVKLSQLQNYQKVYSVYLLGEWKSPHILNIIFRYDFDDTKDELHRIDLTKEVKPYQIRIDPKRQECRAIKMICYDSDQKQSCESFTLSGMRLEIGQKSKITTKKAGA